MSEFKPTPEHQTLIDASRKVCINGSSLAEIIERIGNFCAVAQNLLKTGDDGKPNNDSFDSYNCRVASQLLKIVDDSLYQVNAVLDGNDPKYSDVKLSVAKENAAPAA